MPGQMKLPFALWTRPAIKALSKEEFGIEVQDRLVGKFSSAGVLRLDDR